MEKSALQNSTEGFYIFADDSASMGTGKTGLTITVTQSKNGAAEVSISPTITEIGDGVYWVAPIAAHRNTLGRCVFKFTATGAIIAPRFERITSIDVESNSWPKLVAAASGNILGAAQTGTLTDTEITSDLTGYGDNTLIGRIIFFYSGTAIGCAAIITAYASTNGRITFSRSADSSVAIATTPADGDQFVIA